MASRTYFPGPKVGQIETKEVFGTITVSSVAASGTISKELAYASGTRTGVGTLRVTLDDSYAALLWANLEAINPTASTRKVFTALSASNPAGVRSGSVQVTPPSLDFNYGYMSQSSPTGDKLVLADPSADTTFMFRAVFKTSMV
jgi:hypothetical protein